MKQNIITTSILLFLVGWTGFIAYQTGHSRGKHVQSMYDSCYKEKQRLNPGMVYSEIDKVCDN